MMVIPVALAIIGQVLRNTPLASCSWRVDQNLNSLSAFGGWWSRITIQNVDTQVSSLPLRYHGDKKR